MKVTIRNAQRDDLDALVALLDILFSIEADFSPDMQRQCTGLALMLRGGQTDRCMLVADLDGQVVGMCSAQSMVSTAEGGPVALIEDMVVLPDYRGMGIGRQLMQTMESWAREQGITRLQLLADRTNFSALDFYDKLGWHPTQLICLRRKWG